MHNPLWAQPEKQMHMVYGQRGGHNPFQQIIINATCHTP